MLLIDPDRILSITNGNRSLAVLFTLAETMDDDHISRLSIIGICDRTGLGRQTVSRHLNKLKNVGAIKIMKSEEDHRMSIYRVTNKWCM